MAENVSDLAAKIRARKAAEQPQWDADLIPEVGDDDERPRSRGRDAITDLLDRVDILEAYTRWCGKMVPNAKGKHENIMVSCPNPSHADTNPSAWISTDKQCYKCGVCDEGGDKFHIAGFHFGLDPRTQFKELREAMAMDLGYVVQRTAGQLAVVPESEAPKVIDITPMLPEYKSILREPTIDWRQIVPPDTFLWRWMEITTKDDLPNEYYFWLGLTALGLAVGHDVEMKDNPEVKTNLYLCLYGRSGVGKTRASRALSELLRKAVPYDESVDCRGVQIVPVPGSAEALIDSFSKSDVDANTNIRRFYPVRGLVRFDELSSLMGKSARAGSILKPTLMEFYDSYEPVKSKSRGAGLVVAEEHFCAAITTTQPGAIRRLLVRDDAESGFVNRWIFVSGPEKEPVPYQRERLDIDPCVMLLQGIWVWAGTGHRLEMVGDAADLWNTFFKQELDPRRKQDDSDLLTRCDLHLKKLITLLAINEKSEITLDIVRRALMLWPYLLESYGLVGAEIGSGPFQDAYDATIETVKMLEDSLGHAPKRRDIVRKIGRKHGADAVSKALKVAEDLGTIEVTTTKAQRGSPVVTYHYVP